MTRGYTDHVSETPNISPGVQAFGLFVRGLVRFGWIPIVGVLLIAWLLEWGSGRQILAIGIALALLIALSPMALGVVATLDSRRRNKPSDESNPHLTRPCIHDDPPQQPLDNRQTTAEVWQP